MNTQILQNCVDELNKETPRLEYVVGVLETLIAVSGGTPINKQIISNKPIIQEKADDEDPALRAYLSGGTGRTV